MRDTTERALAEIQPFCSERFPDHYAGFAVFPRPGKQPGVTVFRRPSTLFDPKVRERFADLGDALTFADARWSAKYLEELAQRVTTDRQYWADLGIHIHKVIPSPSGEEPVDRHTRREQRPRPAGDAVRAGPGRLRQA